MHGINLLENYRFLEIFFFFTKSIQFYQCPYVHIGGKKFHFAKMMNFIYMTSEMNKV